MEDVKSEVPKGIPESGNSVLVVEVFRPSNGPPRLNDKKGSIFEQPVPIDSKSKWSRNIDFLFVCTGHCAGLGNFWRLPSIAIRYGGGSFLIAYFVSLVILGLPMLYLEVVLGQFASRSGTRIFDCASIMRGLGYVQLIVSVMVASYYSSIASIAGKYLIATFDYELPWSDGAVQNSGYKEHNKLNQLFNGNDSSARIYYRNNVIADISIYSSVLQLFSSNMELFVYLLISWVAVGLITIKGLRVISQLACFLLFATVAILIAFFAQIVITPGAKEGVINYLKPDWTKFINLEIWYDSMIQVFFTLGICFGPIATYASFNKFSYNMFIDILITISVNCLLAFGIVCTYFAILGSIAPTSIDIDQHTRNWFVYYSEAIARLEQSPQITSILIFALMVLMAIVSISAFTFFIVKMLRDEFLIKNEWRVVVPIVFVMFLLGWFHLTPIGQYVVILLDQYAIPWTIGLCALLEFFTFAWIYGVKRICDDIEFMFGFRTRFVWRMAWYLLPFTITSIFVYHLIYGALHLGISTDDKSSVTTVGYFTGWGFICLAIFVIGIWAIYMVTKQPKGLPIKRWTLASRPLPNWGPAETSLLLNYRYFILKKDNTTI